MNKNSPRRHFQNFSVSCYKQYPLHLSVLFRREQTSANAQVRRAPQAPKDQSDLRAFKGRKGPWDLGAIKVLKDLQGQWALEVKTELKAHREPPGFKDQWAPED